MTVLSHRFHWSVLARAGVLTITLGLALASPATAGSEQKFYQQHNLVSDGFVPADHVDPNLVNPWGLSSSGTSPFWVSDNGTGVSTLYNGAGEPFPVGSPLVVTIPHGTPTGQVFNGTADFTLDTGFPSFFIFATEDGTISGWSLFFPTFLPTAAILKVDNSAAGAVYKGLAIGSNASGNFLYAANFSAGTIDVFDKNFAPASLPGSFSDPRIPVGFAPFNIQNLEGKLYVTYAKQNAAKHDDVAGKGNGFIDVFDTDGNFLQRVDSQSKLNSPWGLAFAPTDFGRFSNDLLVGNFGDGRINAYSREGGHFHFHGQLQSPDGQPISIDGLWALRFGNGGTAGPTNVLFFTAGINDEQDGLFGSLTACQRNQCQ
jgi:uncharacterized protein (TIGR03118 family)